MPRGIIEKPLSIVDGLCAVSAWIVEEIKDQLLLILSGYYNFYLHQFLKTTKRINSTSANI